MEEIQFRKSHLNDDSKTYIKKLLYEEIDLNKK